MNTADGDDNNPEHIPVSDLPNNKPQKFAPKLSIIQQMKNNTLEMSIRVRRPYFSINIPATMQAIAIEAVEIDAENESKFC